MLSSIKKIKIILMTFIFLFCSFCAEAKEQQKCFFSIADIHFDPFAGCIKNTTPCPLLNKLQQSDYHDWDKIFAEMGPQKISAEFHDTNYPLFKKALTEIKASEANLHPEFVLVLGDFLAHHFRKNYRKFSGDKSPAAYQLFVKKVFQFLIFKIGTTFPDIDVYPLVGNNDSYTGNYNIVPNGKFFHDMSDIWSSLVKNKINKQHFRETFGTAGYYKVSVAPHCEIILLNSVLFSKHIRLSTSKDAALAQLQWLNKKLQNAESHHDKIIIALHIPIGIDIDSTLKKKFSQVDGFWHPEYESLFEKQLDEYAQLITAILPGHVHLDLYQLFAFKKADNIPVIFTPSISPNLGNNPAFKIFYYDPSNFSVKDYKSNYLS